MLYFPRICFLTSENSAGARSNRSKERAIAEAIKTVKQISKKGLEDYYQLSFGETYEFYFSAYLDDKVGVLSTFIKDMKSQRKIVAGKMGRHQRRLKITQEDISELNFKPSKNKSKKAKTQKSRQAT